MSHWGQCCQRWEITSLNRRVSLNARSTEYRPKHPSNHSFNNTTANTFTIWILEWEEYFAAVSFISGLRCHLLWPHMWICYNISEDHWVNMMSLWKKMVKTKFNWLCSQKCVEWEVAEGFGSTNCTHESADARRGCEDVRRVCPQRELG